MPRLWRRESTRPRSSDPRNLVPWPHSAFHYPLSCNQKGQLTWLSNKKILELLRQERNLRDRKPRTNRGILGLYGWGCDEGGDIMIMMVAVLVDDFSSANETERRFRTFLLMQSSFPYSQIVVWSIKGRVWFGAKIWVHTPMAQLEILLLCGAN